MAAMASAATAADKLQPRAAAVATKTPLAIAMEGAQTTINNQLKLAAAMATEMAMMTATMKNEKEDVSSGGGSLAAAWRQGGNGGGGSGNGGVGGGLGNSVCGTVAMVGC